MDTAGRLHVDEELMAELQRIKEAIPVDETLLVIDAMAGQDAVNVAKAFGESTGLDLSLIHICTSLPKRKTGSQPSARNRSP